MTGSRLFGTLFLASAVMSGVLDRPCAADPLVTIMFGGTGTATGSAVPVCFTGTLVYDQSHSATSSGKFVFAGSGDTFSLAYQIDNQEEVFADPSICTTFTITTSTNGKKNFVLKEQPGVGTTIATVTLVTTSMLSQISLPVSTGLPSPPPPPPQPSSTFILSNPTTGAATFTGTITVVVRSQSSFIAPAPQAPAFSYAYIPPCPPQYVSAQRRSCFSGLFARRSHRICGR
jgi:hypothetical protein